MQIVAVTDPLQLGFGRQAMVGIHVDGRGAAGRRRALGDGGGHLRGDDRRHLRRALRGGQHRRRGAARPGLGAASARCPAYAPPRPSCTSSWPSRPTRGACAEHRRTYRSLSLWHDTVERRPPPRRRPARPRVVRRGGGRRRADRPLVGVLPASGPTPRCGSRCSSRRSPASAPRDATAAGAARCSPPRGSAWSRASADGRRAASAPRDAGDRPRGRPGGRRARASTPTTSAAARSPSPAPRCSSSASPTGSRTAHGRGFTEDDERLLGAEEARVAAGRRAASSAAPSPRTAPRSTRPGWSAASRASSSPPASPCSSRPGSPRSSRGGSSTAAGEVRADVVLRATEGYTAAARRAAAHGRAGLLADGRHRAARRRDLGVDRPRRTGRPSATGGT